MRMSLFLRIWIAGMTCVSSQAIAGDMKENIRNLVNKDMSKQTRAEMELKKDRDAALPALLDTLDAPDPELRAKVVRVLKVFKSSNSFKALAAKVVTDTDWQVRQEAISAVGRFNHPEVEAVLRRAIKDRIPQNRIAAARLLSFRAKSKALPELQLLLGDADKTVRLAVARELGRYGDRSGLAVAQDGLKDADWRVRVAACEAIGTSGDIASGSTLDTIAIDKAEKPAVRLAALQARHQIELSGKSSLAEQIDYLQRGLSNSIGGVRTWAAYELARKIEPEALAILRKIAQDPRALGQREAASALNTRKEP